MQTSHTLAGQADLYSGFCDLAESRVEFLDDVVKAEIREAVRHVSFPNEIDTLCCEQFNKRLKALTDDDLVAGAHSFYQEAHGDELRAAWSLPNAALGALMRRQIVKQLGEDVEYDVIDQQKIDASQQAEYAGEEKLEQLRDARREGVFHG